MSQINVNIRMDSEVKQQAEKLFQDLGMNMTTAINVFVKQAIRARGIPFQIVSEDPFYSAENQAHLRRTADQIQKGDVVVKTMEELEAMAADE